MFGPLIIVGGAIITIILLVGILASMYKQVPPNRALIVYGWGGSKIIAGGGVLVFPIIQSAQHLSLELMSFDVAPEQDLYTSQGVSLKVEAVTQIKVKNDTESIKTAAEQFLDKSDKEFEDQLRLVMEGHLRGIVGTLTVEKIVKNPEEVAQNVLDNVSADLAKMGLSIVSFTIKRVSDDQDYIKNMGRPDVAKIKQAAEIAEAEAAREITTKKAEAMKEAAEAQARADQSRVAAQAASEAEQAQALRDLNLRKAEYEAEVNRQRAVAEKAFEISTNQAQQQAIAEQVRIAQIEKQEQIRVQELEVKRRELELEGTVIKQANADKRRIEIMAEAEGLRAAREAEGLAEAAKSQAIATRTKGEADADIEMIRGKADAEVAKAKGLAEAEVIKIRGAAEAEVVKAKGQAEADAMLLRAQAYEKYNQAAVVDLMLDRLPEMAKSFAEALGNVDKITIVSTGDGGKAGGGASALTGEVAKMVSQVPEVIESLTGISVGEIVKRLPGAIEPRQAVKTVPIESDEA